MKVEVTQLHNENKNLKDKVIYFVLSLKIKKFNNVEHYSSIDKWNDDDALSEDGRK